MDSEKSILLHICCAPCACYPIGKLDAEGFSVTGYWYNPNIHGFIEYTTRLMTLGYYVANINKIDIIEDQYDVENWFTKCATLSSEERCRECYRMRIDTVARNARARGIRWFSTTLLYSKHQRHDEIREIASDAALKHGVNFFYKDFRTGWKEGIKQSIANGLYRQQYCACIFSEIERYNVSRKN